MPPDDVATPDNRPGVAGDEGIWFTNQLGLVLTDLAANAGATNTNGDRYLNANLIELVDGPAPVDPQETDEYFWGVRFKVEYA